MRVATLITLLFCVACDDGCNGPPPPPVTTTTTLEPPPSTTTVSSCVEPCQIWREACRCPKEYFRLWPLMKDEDFAHIGDYWQSTYENALWAMRQQLIWDGVRNPIYALNTCPDMFPWEGITAGEARAAIEASQQSLDRLLDFIDPEADPAVGNWTLVHRLLAWPDRSRVRKEYFEIWYSGAAVLLFDNGIVARLNGIAGACKEWIK